MDDFEKDPVECDHDGDTVTADGHGRWVGGTWVQDTVEACAECGAVLAVDP